MVLQDVTVTGMFAGHKCVARRRADIVSRVSRREHHAFGSQPVNVRGQESFLNVATQITVTQFVGENENDVGPILCEGRAGQQNHQA